jgi:hypothetical protein
MRHQEIVTSTTPWLGSANCANPDGDISTTRGYPASSRSSTVHVVLAPVATVVTVSTVPNGSVGLAHIPGGASAYHVACPCSVFVAAGTTGGGGVVAGVAVVSGVSVTRAEASSTTGDDAGAVVVVVMVVGVGGATVVGVVVGVDS